MDDSQFDALADLHRDGLDGAMWSGVVLGYVMGLVSGAAIVAFVVGRVS